MHANPLPTTEIIGRHTPLSIGWGDLAVSVKTAGAPVASQVISKILNRTMRFNLKNAIGSEERQGKGVCSGGVE